MKKLCLAALLILLGAVGQSFAASAVLTTNASSCPASTNTSALVVYLPQDKGGATLTISGTWTGTISFYWTGDGGTTWRALGAWLSSTPGTIVTSATTDNTWQTNPSGGVGICMLSSASMTGSATVTVNYSAPSAARIGSGGGGGGSPGGSSGDLQTNNGSGSFGAAALNDNGTTITATESITPAVAAAKNLGTAPLPFGDLFLGNAANQSFDFTVSALTTNRHVAVQDAASTITTTAQEGQIPSSAPTGILRGGSPFTGAELSGDATTSGSNAVSVVKVNGNTPGGTCTNQFTRSIDSSGRPTCATVVSTDTDSSIAHTGVDINTSYQITTTHLSAALPVNQGGTGTTSTLTGLMRGNASAMTAAEISGDCTTSGSNAITCKPTLPAAGSSGTFSGSSYIFVCSTTCTITVPVPAAGLQYCAMNGDNVSTVITLSAIGSSARYENQARTAYGTAGTGTLVSGGAVKDSVCILGLDSTHYLFASGNGTWTAN